MHATPCFWFDNNGEEAIKFYTSLFKDSKVVEISRNGDNGPGPKGTMLTGIFTILGREYMILNGGPHFKQTEAASIFVSCDSQKEVDTLWEKLTAGGGEESMCGWLKDRFGVSWQIVPKRLMELMGDKDPVKANRVMQAMLKMRKIECSLLQQAYDGQ